MNLKANDYVIDVGGKGQAFVNGFQRFITQFSDMIDKEIGGFYYTPIGKNNENDISHIYVGKYINNTDQGALLGVHEIKHVIYTWMGVDTDTHHLNYLFQMGHFSWDKTTDYLKKDGRSDLNDLYNTYENYNNNPLNDSVYMEYRNHRIFPYPNEQFKPIENDIINIISDETKMAKIDSIFTK